MSVRQALQLVFFKAYVDLRSETTRTYIGIAWWVLDPIIYMGVFYLVFEKLLQRGGPGFVQFLLVGIVFYRWFSNSVSNGMNSIAQGRGLMQQVYLPKILFPLVTFVSDLVKFAITLVLLLAFLWIVGEYPGVSYLALAPLLLVNATLILGASFVVSSITPVIPDMRFVIGHFLMMLLFLSGIFYDASRIPESFQTYFYLNPVACLLEAYRAVLLDQQWPDPGRVAYAALVGALLLLLGALIIRALDRRYPKIVRAKGA